MSRKFIVELDDKVYEDLQTAFLEAKKINPDFTFEMFLSEILVQFAQIKNQTSNIFSDSFKSIIEKFDPSKLEDLFYSMKKMGDIFNANKVKKEEKPEKQEEDNIQTKKRS